MSATTILTTLFRQILAFIARHPRGVPLSWNLLNPIYYLTGYGSWTKTLGAAATAISELAQVVTAKWLFDTHGVEWFRGFGNGHWMIWLPALWFGAYHLQQEVDGVADFAWVCWRMGVWSRGGKLGGSFLMSGLERSGALGRVAEAVDDLVVVVTAGWDGDGNRVI
ncbi:hypothetical protein D6C79_08626 [Aureobasidium pullulans]|nr:hypothetical protein D6C79_08626 [Aureobasidium pullulans]